jgi:DNA-binding transcriptional regulator YdaS (Cro superfamily)
VQTLEYAAMLVGGEEQLADKVGATPAELSSWLSGRERTPMAVFKKAVDIVSDFALIKLSAAKPE